MLALDTNILIYVLENNPEFGRKAAALLQANEDNVILSELVYAEILSAPKMSRTKNRQIAAGFLDSLRVEFVPLTKEVLLLAANMRAAHTPKLGLGDALHLACAITAGAEKFVTNDRQLAKLHIKDLTITML